MLISYLALREGYLPRGRDSTTCCPGYPDFIPGDGCRPRKSAFRGSAVQPSAAGTRVPAPLALMPSGTRILELCPRQSSGFPMLPPLSSVSPYTRYSILNTLVSSGPSCPRTPLVPVSPCQHVPSRKRVPTCHLAHVPPLFRAWRERAQYFLQISPTTNISTMPPTRQRPPH